MQNLSKSDLKKICEEKQIPVRSQATKKQLIAAIEKQDHLSKIWKQIYDTD